MLTPKVKRVKNKDVTSSGALILPRHREALMGRQQLVLIDLIT